jgi:hypothetical protein
VTKREFVVPHTNISRGFVTMESGSWDLFYFLGHSLPGMKPGHGGGNATALKEYWDDNMASLAATIGDALANTADNALHGVALFLRDQPLPRCHLEPVGVIAHLPPPRPFRGAPVYSAPVQTHRITTAATEVVCNVVGVATAVVRRDDAVSTRWAIQPAGARLLARMLLTLSQNVMACSSSGTDLTRGKSSTWRSAGTRTDLTHRPRLIDLQLKEELRRLPPRQQGTTITRARCDETVGGGGGRSLTLTDIRRNQQKVERR